MGEYAQDLAAIRKARDERDNAADNLYRLQIEHIRLKKSITRKDRGDLKIDPDQADAIRALQDSLKVVAAKLSVIQDKLQKLASAHQLLTEQTVLLKALAADEAALEDQISQLSRNLEDPAASAADKAKWATQLSDAKERRAALQQKMAELQQKLARLREQTAQAEHDAQELEAAHNKLQEEQKAQQATLDAAVKSTKEASDGGDLEASRKKINEQISVLDTKKAGIQQLVDRFYAGKTPQELISEWDDSIPIALFPVRVETKFHFGDGQPELWVRIFPDDIEVVTHEKVLTDQELEYGKAYWTALFEAGSDEEKKKAAWRMLTDKFGPNRSAWVALQTKPVNWANQPGSADELQFPVVDITKPGTWSEAPHTRILPDRFVLMGYKAGKLAISEVGRQVSDILVLGPAPMGDADNPSITRNESDQRLNYGDEFKWLVDFNIAVNNGMGFKVQLKDSATANAGFDQLLVLGVKLSANEQDGKQLLESLIDNHHYSKNGFSLVPQGTPTNNTDEADAGFTKKDPLQELSYFVETGSPLFTPTSIWSEVTDGQRLAEYLGIDYASLQYIGNANGRDHAEATAMNKALYAGSFGFFLKSMLNEVVDDTALGKVRHHFNNYVTGRGPVAAVRVGNQPYGIMPVSVFSKWKYNPDRRFLHLEDPFYSGLYNILRYLDAIWTGILPQLAHISKSGDTGANLMSVLGLNPGSVEYFQRVAYTFDTIRNEEQFLDGGKYSWDVFKMEWNQFIIPGVLKQFGYQQTRSNGSTKPVPLLLQLIYQHFHSRLDPKNLVDGLPFSEQNKIKPYDDATGRNYIDWLLLNTGSSIIEKEDFGGAAKPSALLYMMLRHSLLHETSSSLFNFLAKNKIDAAELVLSRKFSNISKAPTVSHWEVFSAPVNQLVPAEGVATPLYEYIHSPRFSGPADTDIVANLNEHKEALALLKDLPTARLERCFGEHLDCLSYRLDAWQTSLYDSRLRGQRLLNGELGSRRTGIYLGAYGYLENVKPQPARRVQVPEDILPVSLQEKKNNLFLDPDNGGYVHAPSLNHATAAAILRNGYLTHANATEKEALSVNLSSERVRRAQYLVEGIRNGQTLEVLLGYQFERGLHDWSTRASNPVILADLIPLFRTAFPIKKTKVPQEGKTTGPEETIEDFHVVNGLDLAKSTAAFPWGASLPALSNDKVNALKQEKDNIANTLDALRDLLTSESAYQLALGNFERAAAVMQSISGGQMPPDIDVINTSRGTSLSFTNKVVVQFDSTFNTNPWPATGMNLRSQTEPGLNHWLGQLMGDPASTRCFVQAVDQDGNVLKRGDNTAIEETVTIADLQLQPADIVYLISNKLEQTGYSELESRVRYYFAAKNSLSDATIVKISFNNSGTADLSIRSFAELLPLADYARQLICSAKPLGASHFRVASKTLGSPPADPDNYVVTDLRTRVEAVFAAVKNKFIQLESAAADAESLRTPATVTALRGILKALADGGYSFAFPQSAFGDSPVEIDMLVTQAKSLIKGFDTLSDQYAAQLAKVDDPSATPAQQVSLLTEMAKSLLGKDYVIMPRFNFLDPSELAFADSSRANLLGFAATKSALPVDEWLHGVAQVRPSMHLLEMLRLLTEAMGNDYTAPSPIQLPYQTNDNWLAVEIPEGTTVDHDTHSILQYLPQGFNAASIQCGLMIDNWRESIPNKEEVTGITFNYNQPNSVPPQAILLAITPEQTGNWTWDDLATTVLDTFAAARKRAVEPDLLDQHGVITVLLPALLAEFSTSPRNISLDYSLNIAAVAKEVATLQYLK